MLGIGIFSQKSSQDSSKSNHSLTIYKQSLFVSLSVSAAAEITSRKSSIAEVVRPKISTYYFRVARDPDGIPRGLAAIKLGSLLEHGAAENGPPSQGSVEGIERYRGHQ